MVLGITGGICSGKSSATKYLAELGGAIVDADAIARRLMSPGTQLTLNVLASVGAEFALEQYPVAIDRAKLGVAVFADPVLRRTLEAVVHPAIVAELAGEIEHLKTGSACQLILGEVPLLFEAKLEGLFDSVLVVSCSESTQRSRLRIRMPQLEEEQITERIKSQIPLNEKAEAADYVVSSEQSLELMKADLLKLYDSLGGNSK